MPEQLKKFRFAYTRPVEVCSEDKRTGFFFLELTQAEFEDYQHLKTRIHHELDVIGIPAHESAHWYETPEISDDLLVKLREAFGADTESMLIPYYPHGWRHSSYREAIVDGTRYLYMGFQNGRFIKFSCDIEQPPPTCSSLFDGPIKMHDHGHIKTPEHASLFKTGELDLPGQNPRCVKVRFANFAFNDAQKRFDAVFEALDAHGQHVGHYFASAFRSLVL